MKRMLSRQARHAICQEENSTKLLAVMRHFPPGELSYTAASDRGHPEA
jgi:hypothetical protein